MKPAVACRMWYFRARQILESSRTVGGMHWPVRITALPVHAVTTAITETSENAASTRQSRLLLKTRSAAKAQESGKQIEQNEPVAGTTKPYRSLTASTVFGECCLFDSSESRERREEILKQVSFIF